MVSQVLRLVGTGLSLGVVHVLTGPDHLSALATLSANVKYRSDAFLLGIRWGIGHSTGLLVVGGIFLLISAGVSSAASSSDESIQIPEQVSHFFESLVGLFMLALGTYGIHRACVKRQQICENDFAQPNDPDCTDEEFIESIPAGTPVPRSSNRFNFSELIHYHDHDDTEHGHQHRKVSTSDIGNTLNSNSSRVAQTPDVGLTGWFYGLLSQISTQTMAFSAGVIHGLAGPGGVLGVIPAVQLHNLKLATVYLFCFCVSSMFTMGVFAMMYGSVSHIIASRGNRDRAYLIECISASLSLLVGIVWLLLLSLGKLDEVFP